MAIFKVAVVWALIALTGAFGSRAMAQQVSSAKAQTLAVIQWNGDVAFILSHLTRAYDVTIGLEIDPQHPKTDVGFYLREATLPDALNAIVQSAPKYQWRERDGFFEVLPLAESNALLDTMVYNFRVIDVDQAEALKQLLSLPELQAAMKAMNLSRRYITRARTDEKVEKFSLSLEGVTMRQALNKIAQAGGSRFWLFRTEGARSFSIDNSPD